MSPGELKSVRHGLGISQNKMALLLEVPRRTYQGWEQGQRRMSPTTDKYIRLVLKNID